MATNEELLKLAYENSRTKVKWGEWVHSDESHVFKLLRGRDNQITNAAYNAAQSADWRRTVRRAFCLKKLGYDSAVKIMFDGAAEVACKAGAFKDLG